MGYNQLRSWLYLQPPSSFSEKDNLGIAVVIVIIISPTRFTEQCYDVVAPAQRFIASWFATYLCLQSIRIFYLVYPAGGSQITKTPSNNTVRKKWWKTRNYKGQLLGEYNVGPHNDVSVGPAFMGRFVGKIFQCTMNGDARGRPAN